MEPNVAQMTEQGVETTLVDQLVFAANQHKDKTAYLHTRQVVQSDVDVCLAIRSEEVLCCCLCAEVLVDEWLNLIL